jgi:hypothetical protein
MGDSARFPPRSFSDSYVSVYLEPGILISLTSPGIVNACDPQNFEPNLALNLEIADLINAKKGSA